MEKLQISLEALDRALEKLGADGLRDLIKEVESLDIDGPTFEEYFNGSESQYSMNKTIAQQLNIKEFPFEIKDKNGNEIYYEHSSGYWDKSEYDQNGKQIYYEDSTGYWRKSEYDQNGNEIYYESSSGYWDKSEYDQNGNEIYYESSTGYWSKSEYDKNDKQIYYESSDGYIEDNRPNVVELTLDEIATKLNIDVNLLKIKK